MLMRKLWKIYKYLAITAVSLLILDLAVVMFFSLYTPKIDRADAIVILGAAINTPALYNRSLEGLELYEQGKAPVMVLSGGRISQKHISEATSMQRTIQQNTNKPLNLVLEEESHSTYENIKNTKGKIGSGKSIVVVSDQYHLARAVIMAKRQGFGPVYWSSPEPGYYKKSELAFYYIREVMAIFVYIPKFITG